LRGEIIGVGEAINKKDGLFTEEDAEILQILAAHVSDTIETTHLDRQLQVQPSDKPQNLRDNDDAGFSTQNILGMSHSVQAIIRLIDQIRDSSVDVLIQGESGTGKELVAKALHHNSPRAKRAFVALNCAALPEGIVEAELFGIEKGVATGVDQRVGKFEQANRGTLFLDEIGDLSLASQAKILRVLQERSVTRVGGRAPVELDVRIIAATSKDLDAAIKEGSFRADLYFRLKVIHIQMPALRQIPEDVSLLANHFLAKYCVGLNTGPKQFTPVALECLASYHWPGNTRELENEIKRLVASTRGSSITENDLSASIRNSRRQTEPPEKPLSRLSLRAAVAACQRRMIEDALRESRGNKQKAAQALGLSRQGLIKKIKQYGIGPSMT
jgi:DNA-binding NtrC family response regulator